MQAGHFGQAVFDPAGLTDDYKRQAEVSIYAFSHIIYACLAAACSLQLDGSEVLIMYTIVHYYDQHVALRLLFFELVVCSLCSPVLQLHCLLHDLLQ